jgi:hypothetical protein
MKELAGIKVWAWSGRAAPCCLCAEDGKLDFAFPMCEDDGRGEDPTSKGEDGDGVICVTVE